VKGQVTRQCVQKEKTDQGKLAYEDEQGSTRICNFSLDQVDLSLPACSCPLQLSLPGSLPDMLLKLLLCFKGSP